MYTWGRKSLRNLRAFVCICGLGVAKRVKPADGKHIIVILFKGQRQARQTAEHLKNIKNHSSSIHLSSQLPIRSLCKSFSQALMEGFRLVVAKFIVFSQILEGLTCQDAVPGWADSEGRTCEVYVNSNWCTSQGKYGSGWEFNQGERHKNFASFRSGNYTAFQACCGCGADAQRPTCTEMFPGWVDSDGNSCEDYVSKNWCTATGHYGVGWHLSDRKSFGHYSNQNKSAIQACCGCGADVSSTGCENQLSGWTDDVENTCDVYVNHNWCTSTGDYGSGFVKDLGNFGYHKQWGLDASQACCGCGAVAACNDPLEDWVDSSLYTCAEYVDNNWCTPDGAYGSGWDMAWGTFGSRQNSGYTAVEACCGCGAKPETRQCTDALADWMDSEKNTCSTYVLNKWCTSDGGYGTGWDFSWGSFATFATQNHSAFQACCGCGADAQRPTCTEMFPGWVDSDGNSCEDYVSKNWCTATGHYGVGWHLSDRKSFGHYSNQNKSAIQACCGCGADVSSTGCENQLSGWTDSIGFTCRDYADQNWCSASGYGAGWDFRNWGSFATVANYGFTALEACCLCSAGSSPCMDSDAWFDSDLKTCSSYGQQKWCTSSGGYGAGWDHTTSFLDLANPWDNTTALEACCVCGGGTTCIDRSGWVDSIGRGCDEYASLCATSINSTLIQGR